MKLSSLNSLFALLLTTFLITACGGGGGSGNDNKPTPPSNPDPPVQLPDERDGIDLSAITLAKSTVAPFKAVQVMGLPEDLSSAELYAEYQALEGDIVADAGNQPRQLMLFTRDDKVFLLPPLLDVDGATITTVITDGISRSDTFTLIVEALPPARQGAVDDLLTSVNLLLKETTEALDKTYPDEWEHWRDNELNQMPEYLLPVMLAWHTTMNAENPHALVNQNFDDETRETLERVLAAMPLLDALQLQTEFIATGNSSLSAVASSPMLRTSSVTRLPSPAVPAAAVNANGYQAAMQKHIPQAPPWMLEGLLDIPNAHVLAEHLDLYEAARWEKQSLELFDATIGTYFATIATVASLPLGPGGQALVGTARLAALEAVSNVTSLLAELNGVAMWFLPCCIVELDTQLNIDNGVIRYEDELSPQVILTDAWVTAESEGVDLTRDITERIVKTLSSDIVNVAMNDAVTRVYGEAVADQIDDYGAATFVEKFIDQNLQLSREIRFRWEKIDLVAMADVKRWLKVEPDTLGGHGKPILEEQVLTESRYEFFLNEEAFERTDSLLRFIVNQDELHSQIPVAMDTHQIELHHIQVEFDPPIMRLEEESTDPVPFTVHVKNSKFHRSDEPYIEMPLTLEPPIGEIRQVRWRVVPDRAEGEFLFEYVPPADPDDLPRGTILKVSTESISTGGIRDPLYNPPPRTGFMHIARLGDPTNLAIEPDTACVEAGKTIQLSLVDADFGDAVNDDVTWEASHGRVSDSGVFTAPTNGAGQARVIARMDDITAAADIIYGDCSCWWSGSVSGGLNQRHGWDLSTLVLDDQSRVIEIRNFGMSDNDRDIFIPGFALNLRKDPIPLGATGDFSATIGRTPLQGAFVSGPADQSWVNPMPIGELGGPPPLTVTITKNEPLIGDRFTEGSRQLAGRISGTVVEARGWEKALIGEQPITATLNAQWSGTYWVGIPLSGGNINCSRLPE